MPMTLRYLGRTGVRVSPLTLGCMMFGGRTSPEDSYAIIDRAIDAGINILDTANVYNDGKSEEVTGQALKRNGHRDRIFLATKVHGNMHKDDKLHPAGWGNSRYGIMEQCEASLKRLGVSHIDLYQIHRPQPDCAIDETLRALDDLIRQGKVRYIGTSTFAAWQVVESLWASEKLGLNRFVTEQPPYHLLDRRIERELIPACQTYGIGIIPWSPLAGGFLTGKYRKATPPPADSRFGDAHHMRAGMLKNDAALATVEKLEAFAQTKSVPLSQLALAWCMSKPGITSPIIGPRTMEQLEDNLKAADLTLSEADHKEIDQICPPGEHVASFYNASFGPHPYRV
ncbi:MAG: aldo/keto reductase [Tepidisphaeraceae bacterium]